MTTFLNGTLFAWVIALAAWWGFSALDTWNAEREARITCVERAGHSTVLVRADGRTTIRCGKRQPDIRLAKAKPHATKIKASK